MGVAESQVRRVFDVFENTPAVLLGPFTDVVLENDPMRFLLVDFLAMPAGDRYAIKWHPFAPESRVLYGDAWEGVTTELIGMLRLQAGRPRGDPRI